MAKKTVLVEVPNYGATSSSARGTLKRLETEGLAGICYIDPMGSDEAVVSELVHYDPEVVIASAKSNFSNQNLSQARDKGLSNLQAIVRHGIGFDNVDTEYCTEAGIYVINTPNAPSKSVAHYVLESIYRMTSGIGTSSATMGSDGWAARSGRDPRDLTIGLIGAGRIPYAFAQMTQHLGFAIKAFDNSSKARDRIDQFNHVTVYDSVDLVLPSDVVSVHLPATTDTINYVDSALFARMRDDTLFINTARGSVVKTTDLIANLDINRDFRAVLDVFYTEPLPKGVGLRKYHPNKVFLTPHVASASNRGKALMAEGAAMAADAVIRGDGTIDPKLIERLNLKQPDDMFGIVVNRK
jgi:D-3-phosphoglycerate dehydrogenase / 2-oxoglutarate reductase